mmetsp:Transcript_6390/g.22487  ORF Transcript_6390/g.22487 Transcript_6390/m.22487 type:complete len:243 (-) Transcript_6390:2690-3418(-)
MNGEALVVYWPHPCPRWVLVPKRFSDAHQEVWEAVQANVTFRLGIQRRPLLLERDDMLGSDDGRLPEQAKGDVVEDGGNKQVGEDVRARHDKRDEEQRCAHRVAAVVPDLVRDLRAEGLVPLGVVHDITPPLARHDLEQQDERVGEGLEVALAVQCEAPLDVNEDLRANACVEEHPDRDQADDGEQVGQRDPHDVEQDPLGLEEADDAEDPAEAERAAELCAGRVRLRHKSDERAKDNERLV